MRKSDKMKYQCNNLKLKWDRLYEKFVVVAPDGRKLEEFRFEKDAILYMQDTKDFLTERGRKRKYGD